MKRDVVVVGASAGGVQALQSLVAGLPADFPAAVLVVLHTSAQARSTLPAILDRAGPLPAAAAQEGSQIRHGHVLVAPPDHHVIVYEGHVTLSRGPRENGHRPAVDVLFRSAARVYGPRVIAVVLSGTLDDGTAGMVAVHRRGGLGVVQDPEDADYSGMPLSAMAADSPAHVVPVGKMGALLDRLVREDVEEPEDPPVDELMTREVGVAHAHEHLLHEDGLGPPSAFACPDCHGVLFEIREGALGRFRCRVGHAWSAESLAARQAVAVEGALWMALRSLEEKAALSDRMAKGARDRGHRVSGASFAAQAEEARVHAMVIRDVILRSGVTDTESAAATGATDGPVQEDAAPRAM